MDLLKKIGKGLAQIHEGETSQWLFVQAGSERERWFCVPIAGSGGGTESFPLAGHQRKLGYI